MANCSIPREYGNIGICLFVSGGQIVDQSGFEIYDISFYDFIKKHIKYIKISNLRDCPGHFLEIWGSSWGILVTSKTAAQRPSGNGHASRQAGFRIFMIISSTWRPHVFQGICFSGVNRHSWGCNDLYILYYGFMIYVYIYICIYASNYVNYGNMNPGVSWDNKSKEQKVGVDSCWWFYVIIRKNAICSCVTWVWETTIEN